MGGAGASIAVTAAQVCAVLVQGSMALSPASRLLRAHCRLTVRLALRSLALSRFFGHGSKLRRERGRCRGCPRNCEGFECCKATAWASTTPVGRRSNRRSDDWQALSQETCLDPRFSLQPGGVIRWRNLRAPGVAVLVPFARLLLPKGIR